MEYIKYTQFDPEKLSFKLIEKKSKCEKYNHHLCYIIPMYAFGKNKIKRFNVEWPFLPINFTYTDVYKQEKPWMNGFRLNLNDINDNTIIFIKMLKEYDNKLKEFINKNCEEQYNVQPVLSYKKIDVYDNNGKVKQKDKDIIKCIYPKLMKSRKTKDKFSTEIINYNASIFKDMYDVISLYDFTDIVKIFEKPYRKANVEKEGRLIMTFRVAIPIANNNITLKSQILPYKIEIKDKFAKILSVIDKREISVEPEMTNVVI